MEDILDIMRDNERIYIKAQEMNEHYYNECMGIINEIKEAIK